MSDPDSALLLWTVLARFVWPNMGPTWVLSAPVGPMNLAIRGSSMLRLSVNRFICSKFCLNENYEPRKFAKMCQNVPEPESARCQQNWVDYGPVLAYVSWEMHMWPIQVTVSARKKVFVHMTGNHKTGVMSSWYVRIASILNLLIMTSSSWLCLYFKLYWFRYFDERIIHGTWTEPLEKQNKNKQKTTK